MKKLFSIFAVVALLTMVVAPVAFATESPLNGIPDEADVPTTGADLLGRVDIIGNWVFAILMAVSLIFIILAAFQFVTGAGDPAKVTEARQKLIYAAVGIAVALLASGFDDILRNILVG